MPGGAREQEVVRARCGDLERAPRTLLAAHVLEVGRRRQLERARRQDGVGLEIAAQVRDGVGEVPEGDRLDAGERRLRRGLGGTEDALETHAPRPLGDREHAADAAQPSVERELADRGVTVELVVRHLARRGQDRERDREVVAGALLAKPRGREVDGDPAARELELRRDDPALDALPRLRARAVGKADDHECGRAAVDVSFHLDASRLETDERMRDCTCEHASTLRGECVRLRAGFVRQRARRARLRSTRPPAARCGG